MTEMKESSEAICKADKHAKMAKHDKNNNPIDPEYVYVVQVNGKVVGEGQGKQVRVAKREAARNALDGQMLQYVLQAKEQLPL